MLLLVPLLEQNPYCVCNVVLVWFLAPNASILFLCVCWRSCLRVFMFGCAVLCVSVSVLFVVVVVYTHNTIFVTLVLVS